MKYDNEDEREYLLRREDLAEELRGSFIRFCDVFYKEATDRPYLISAPLGREPHQIIIARELTKIFRNPHENDRVGITIPPRLGKSVLLCLWVAWCFTHYDDCNFLYISNAHELASRHTALIQTIMKLPLYGELFNVYISKRSQARDHFETTGGGHVSAFGSGGSIVGQNAGIPKQNRFTGAVIIDDANKIEDVFSDKKRAGINENYEMTIRQRAPHGIPIVMLAQRSHAEDLPGFIQAGNDIKDWRWVILKALDDAGNSIDPDIYKKEDLIAMSNKSPYVFHSQMQQNPMPKGGSLFKAEYFPILTEDPDILCTFLTVDTAETKDSWNDATVFSFWGIYKLPNSNQLALHWLDCMEIRVEPKDLEPEFISFWTNCLRYKPSPLISAIENKSTGVTLASVLKKVRGLTVLKIDRNASSGSKGYRYMTMQPYASSGLVSFTENVRHAKMCIDHMCDITPNDSHAHDDIADTFADAIQLALIDKIIYNEGHEIDTGRKIAQEIESDLLRKIQHGKYSSQTYGTTS